MKMGEKVAVFRRLKNMKQEAFAAAMGISQQSVSNLEAEEFIPDEKLEVIAKVLEVSVEAIKNYDEDKIFSYIHNIESNHGTINGDIIGNVIVNEFDPKKFLDLYRELLQNEIKMLDLLKKNKED